VQQKSGWKNKTRPRTEHEGELSDKTSGGGTKVAAKRNTAGQTQIRNEKLSTEKEKCWRWLNETFTRDRGNEVWAAIVP
jgi:hypothetical protein